MKKTPLCRLAVSHAGAALAMLTLFCSERPATAAPAVWTGASGTDTNWSDGLNWSGGTGTGGVPSGGDDVLLGNIGAGTTFGAISNVVDSTGGNFGGYIGTLQFTNTVNSSIQNMLIAPGVTLNATNNTGPFGTVLFAGTAAAGASASIVGAITGPGGTLNVNNTNGTISISQSGGSSALATLNLTNLDTFTANVKNIAIGDYFFGVGSVAAQGSLMLGRTNVISTAWVGNYSSPYTVTLTNAIQLGEGSSATLGGINAFFLGITNAIFTDSIGIGGIKAGGSASTLCTMAFVPAFTNSSPSAYFRGINGSNSRISLWGVGDTAVSGGSSAQCFGKVDFSNGSIDAMIDNLMLGRDRTITGNQQANGSFTFSSGTVDVNTLNIAFQGTPTSTSLGVAVGTMNVKGPNAVLKVNNNIELGHTTLTAAPATLANGTLNVINGSVYANNISVGAVSITNNINLSGARMVVTNSIATNASGLFLMTITNSVLNLTVSDASTKALVQNLNSGGTSNFVELASVPVFSTYPVQIPLIKYTTLGGSGFNFGLTNVPDAAPGAFLSNNVGNKSIDLYLPMSPAPVITGNPQPFSGLPGSTVILGVTNTGNLPQTYQWYYTNGVTTNVLSGNVGPSGGSKVNGNSSPVLTVINALSGDSGGYFVVVANSYGSATSALAQVIISSSPILPNITGLIDQTVTAGTVATIGAAVSGSPVPTVQWQFDGTNLVDGPQVDGSIIGGSATSNLKITNVQYPSSQGTYSLVAVNSAGAVTNTMNLTVIVSPVITNQPANLLVTNGHQASFTVVAGGVPNPTYQWFKNGNPILASANNTATNATLVIATATPADMATYSVTIQNAANSVTSSNATLTVNSSMGVVSTSPANNATAICYDTPLSITFNQAPTLNNLGTIKIYNATNSGTPVDTLDLSLGSPQVRIIAGLSLSSFPVTITNNTATIFPHLGALTSNQTYYVTIDDGAFKDSAGAFFGGISDSSTWQFTTKVSGPVDPANPVVASDGSGDFVTVQGALDSLATNGPVRRLINIRNGNYFEILNVIKTNVTLRGQSRAGTIVGYPNNNNMNGGTGTRMAVHVNAADVAIENLTLVNTTPQGGSQAETLMVDAAGVRFILNNTEVDSRQDTILINSGTSVAYFYNSLITGNFDYVWGGGVLFATNCEIRTIGGTGTPNLAAPRTVNGATGNWQGYSGLMVSNGFSFVECTLTRATGVTNCLMSDHNGSPNGLAAWINCSIDLNCYTNADSTAQTTQLLWEHGCSNLNNTIALDNTKSPFLSFTQLDDGDPRLLAAENAATWLNGWTPQLAPNILSNPTNQSVVLGGTATFAVAATGISDPTYQWLKNGTNINGQTGATLVINNVSAGDATSYSVIVSNAAGVVTSSAATLTIASNTAPALAPVPNQTIGFGILLTVTNVATDPNVPPQTLTFSLVSGPGSVDPATGIFTWQPTSSDSGTTNTVSIAVTDNGSPNLSVTNSFKVAVVPPLPVASSPVYSNGQFTVTISGQTGSYVVQSSSNLVDWRSLLTNGSVPFNFTDTNAAGPMEFYRVIPFVGP